MAAQAQRLPEPEELFLDYVKRMARHRDGRSCLYVHMARLDPLHRTRHHLELVQTRLIDVSKEHEGRVFSFRNGDMALMLHEAPPGLLDTVQFDVRYGFAEDPLVKAEDAGEAVFVQQFDMSWDYDAVEALARDQVAALNAARLEAVEEARLSLDGGAAAKSGSKPKVSVTGVTAHSNGEGTTPEGPLKVSRSDEAARRKRTLSPSASTSLAEEVEERRRQIAFHRGEPVAGRFDHWVVANHVAIGGAALPLDLFLGKRPLYDLVRRNKVPASLTLEVEPDRLFAAFVAAVGMSMTPKLERYLVEEAERGLLPLFKVLSSPVHHAGLGYRLSLALRPETLLSPDFLLVLRDWEQEGLAPSLFWFSFDDLHAQAYRFSYLFDFLHEHGQFIGVRNLPLSHVGVSEAMLAPVDTFSVYWPTRGLETLSATERSDLEELLRLKERGPVILQGLEREEQLKAARAAGFLYGEAETLGAEKLLTL